jgi:hypothetical protein
MKCRMAETLKQQIPLLDYVEGQDWQPGPAHRRRPANGTVSAA